MTSIDSSAIHFRDMATNFSLFELSLYPVTPLVFVPLPGIDQIRLLFKHGLHCSLIRHSNHLFRRNHFSVRPTDGYCSKVVIIAGDHTQIGVRKLHPNLMPNPLIPFAFRRRGRTRAKTPSPMEYKTGRRQDKTEPEDYLMMTLLSQRGQIQSYKLLDSGLIDKGESFFEKRLRPPGSRNLSRQKHARSAEYRLGCVSRNRQNVDVHRRDSKQRRLFRIHKDALRLRQNQLWCR